MPTTTCARSYPPGAFAWDGDLPARLYVVGQDLPAGTYTIKCAEDGTSMEMHLVNDACGVGNF